MNSRERALLIIDQEPIRHGAIGELHEAYAKLRRLRQRLEVFASTDQPAFAHWLRTEFRDELAATARLQTKVDDLEDIVAGVQMIRFAMGCSYHQAYLHFMRRRVHDVAATRENRTNEENGDEQAWDADDGFRTDREKNPRDGESAARSTKRDHAKRKRGNGDKHGDAAAGGSGFAGRDARDTDRASDSENDRENDNNASSAGFFGKLKRATQSTSASLKRRFRELARLLHPDLRGGGDSWTRELWHLAQMAYNSGDLDELEHLLALSRVSFSATESDSSVSELRSALAFLRHSATQLRREINQLRSDLAWDFSNLADKTRLRRRISYDLDYEHEELSERCQELEGLVARWSVPSAKRSTKRREGSRGRSRRYGDFDLG